MIPQPTTSNVSNTQDTNDGTIKLVHINSNSLVPHVPEIKYLAQKFSPHLIAVSETWCTDRVPDTLIDLEHYVILRNDRGLINLDSNKDTMGGGVALFVHKSLTFSFTSTIRSKVSKIGEVEFLIQKLHNRSGSSLVVAVVYRPPSGDSLDEFFAILREATRSVENVIVAGDLNARLEKSNKHTATLRNLIVENQLQLVQTGPSFYRVDPPSWLDAVLIDAAHKLPRVQSSGQSFISGHDYIFIEYELPGTKSAHCFQYRDFKSLKHHPFQCAIMEAVRCAGDALSDVGVDASVAVFNSHLSKTLDEHLPYKTYTALRPPKSYITDDLKTLMKDRDKMYTAFYRSRDPPHFFNIERLGLT